MKSAIFVILCVSILPIHADSTWAETHKIWRNNNAWPNDSIAWSEDRTIEIYRDLTDLWLATREVEAPGFFSILVQYHCFLALSDEMPANAFKSYPSCRRILLVARYRKSLHEPFISAAKIAINRATYSSPPFKALARTADAKPKRYLQLCRERFNSVWINKEVEEK